jgi:hypothetical protein
MIAVPLMVASPVKALPLPLYIRPAPPKPEINPEGSFTRGTGAEEVTLASNKATPPALSVRPPLSATVPGDELLKV